MATACSAARSSSPVIAHLPGRVAQPVGDPRPAIEECYRSKDAYVARVQQAAEALVQQGLLLVEDLPTIAAQAAQRYDLFQGRVEKA